MTVYQRVLQERFALLSPALQRFLGAARGGRALGRLRVARGEGRLRNLVAWLLGVPAAGECNVRLEVSPHGDGQRWARCFGEHVLETTQGDYRGLLVESSGPGSFGFELAVHDGALFFHRRRAWAFGLPIPHWLAPDIEAKNMPNASSGWRVSVRFSVPLLGPIAEYEGKVTAEGVDSGEAMREAPGRVFEESDGEDPEVQDPGAGDQGAGAGGGD